MDTSHGLRAHSRSLEADHFLVDAEVANGRTNNSDHPDMSDDLVEDQNHLSASNGSLGSTKALDISNESVDHDVIHGNISDDNASDENMRPGDEETLRLTFNGTGGVDNSSNDASEKNDFLTDKIQNASFPHAFADEGLEENESSSIAFDELDLNASDKNASNETRPPVNMEDFNEIRNDSESFGIFSVNESFPDKSSNMSLVDMQNESQTFSANVSLLVNVSEGAWQQDNESLLGQPEEGLEENESSIAFEELDLNASGKNASNETRPPVNMEDFNGIRNDSESFGNFSVNESSPDKSSNMSLVDMQNESQTFSANDSLLVNVSKGAWQQDNESLLGQPEEGFEENESSSIAFEELDLNASGKNASNETRPPVNMEDFNGIRNDSESFGHFSVNESSPDKSSNMSLVDMQNESQTFSANVSLLVNVSEGAWQQDNESLLGQPEEGLEENESSSIAFEELDLNASVKNASNETRHPVNMEDFNGIRNDSESFGNFSVNESSPDKSSNMSLVDMQNESQTFSANDSLLVSVSEGAWQQDNESLLGQPEEGLEENESSSIAFEELDLNASGKNASNETRPPVNMEDFNGIRNDSESFANFSVNESSPDKFSNMSLVDMHNESQTFFANVSLLVNVSEGAWQQDNESLLGQPEEGLEENESSSIAFEELDLNASVKNASNETRHPVNMEDFSGIRNDSESFGNFSAQNESQTFSANVSLLVNVSEGAWQQDNESLLGQPEEGLEENESSSIAFEELDLNASDKNASFETALQVNVSYWPLQQDNKSLLEQSDKGLEEGEHFFGGTLS